MKAVLLALLLMSWVPVAAGAQPASKPVPAAAAVPPVLTPGQTQQVLDVLQNDQKRAQFIAVLQNIGKVQAAQAPHAGGIPLQPGSLGAEVLAEASGALGRVSGQLWDTARTLTNFPLFWRWATATVRDPASQARLIAACWKLAVVVLAAGLAEFAVLRWLHGWRERLDHAVPHTTQADIEPAGGSGPDADLTQLRVRPARPSPWGLLRRIPFVLLRLLIDLLPIAAFTVVVYGVLATPLGAGDDDTRVVILGLTNAYIAVRIGLSAVRMMLSPASPQLRLLHMSDASAAYLVRWARRFLVVAIFGYAIDQTLLLFGLYDQVHDAALKVIGLVLHVFALVVVLQCRGRVSRKLRAPPGRHGFFAVLRNRLAETWHVIAIFFIVAVWLVAALDLRHGYALMWRYFAIAMLVLAGARLASIVLTGALDRALQLRPETVQRFPGLDRKAARYHPALRVLINLVVTLVGICVLLQSWGAPVGNWLRHGSLGSRMVTALGTSGVVVLLAFAVWEATNAMIEGHLANLARGAQLARSARLRTLLPMLRTTLLVVIFVFAALMVLSQIGVNTAPLLAGAGVVGIAVGFGSQKLVQDVITGLFLLLENTMQVGDTVTLASLTGTVENLSIRTLRLRAIDGSVHMIPFSSVTTVTNMTRDYGYAVMDVTAGYNEEPDHIADVLREVAAELREDAKWKDIVQGDIDVWGVDKFMDNAWVLRARVRTDPAKRWAVQREFNRRLKYRFDKLAIESPFTSPAILSSNPAPPPDVPPSAAQGAAA